MSRYLLESGSPNGYLKEDGTGVLSLETNDQTSQTQTANARLQKTVDQAQTAKASLVRRVLVDNYDFSNGDSTVSLYISSIFRAGQSFTTDSTGGYLHSLAVQIQSVGSPTGNIVAELYAHSGTYGTDGVPTGSVLATSGTIDVTTIPTAPSLATFFFTGVNAVVLTPNTNYALVVRVTGGNASNYINLIYDSTTPTHPGNFFFDVGSWVPIGTADVIFDLYRNVTFDQVQTALARLQKTVDQVQTAKAAVQKTADQTQTAKAAIQRTVDQTQTAKANITTGATVDKTQIARGRITTTVDQTQTAKARLTVTVDKTQTAKARLRVTNDKVQTAMAFIGERTTQTQTAKAFILNANPPLTPAQQGKIPSRRSAAYSYGAR